MAEQGEYRFEIEGLTPMTLSLRRLNDYLPALVDLFGYEDHIHLIRVDEGSAAPCIVVENHMVKPVQQRLLKVKGGTGSRKTYGAMDDLNQLLAEDHTSAVLRSPYHGLLIEFPGIKQATEPIVGPVIEHTDLQGELIQIGGRDETISLYIRDGKNTFICIASREQGREISGQLFRQVRVSGTGKWVRNELGKWKLVQMTLGSFLPLQDQPLSQSIRSLRALSETVEGERIPIESD
ncbi:MAG TPA: hypothetical protein VME17_08875 [Bryobacteraceae bacterium]|nr:hypothetical protein [Bryobacteraceae bacterium]